MLLLLSERKVTRCKQTLGAAPYTYYLALTRVFVQLHSTALSFPDLMIVLASDASDVMSLLRYVLGINLLKCAAKALQILSILHGMTKIGRPEYLDNLRCFNLFPPCAWLGSEIFTPSGTQMRKYPSLNIFHIKILKY